MREGIDLSDQLLVKHRFIINFIEDAVGSAMKRSNAIIYRIELGMYQLMSGAHKTALKTYTPIIDNSYATPK